VAEFEKLAELGYALGPDERTISFQGKWAPLTETERDLLAALATAHGPLAYESVATRVYTGRGGTRRTLKDKCDEPNGPDLRAELHDIVSTLRSKLRGAFPGAPDPILTVRALGYALRSRGQHRSFQNVPADASVHELCRYFERDLFVRGGIRANAVRIAGTSDQHFPPERSQSTSY